MSIFSKLLEVYRNGGNISEYINANPDIAKKHGLNATDAIELSYDLQAGSYVKRFYANYERFENYNKFIINELKSNGTMAAIKLLKEKITICDFGTGESTNYISFLNHLRHEVKQKIIAYGMDISISRLDVAAKFSAIEAKSLIPEFFIGDLNQLPLMDNCIDISLTRHAIEPNGGREKQILNELIRVSRNYIIFVEPIYETATADQRKRMEHFGYIKELRTLLHESELVDVLSETLVPEELVGNPVNRSSILIAKKKNSTTESSVNRSDIFACPISHAPVIRKDNFWLSSEGSCYPEVNKFPLLRSKFALPYYQQSKFLHQ